MLGLLGEPIPTNARRCRLALCSGSARRRRRRYGRLDRRRHGDHRRYFRCGCRLGVALDAFYPLDPVMPFGPLEGLGRVEALRPVMSLRPLMALRTVRSVGSMALIGRPVAAVVPLLAMTMLILLRALTLMARPKAIATVILVVIVLGTIIIAARRRFIGTLGDRLHRWLWLVGHANRRLILPRAHIVAVVIIIVAELGDVVGAAKALTTIRHIALANRLIAERHYDAIIMLGMLQIVLRQDRISGRLGVTRQRHVFLGNVSRRATDLDVWAIALKIASQRILSAGLAIASAASAVLLSLPHGLPSSMCCLIEGFTQPSLDGQRQSYEPWRTRS
jgi:hypothetical protein